MSAWNIAELFEAAARRFPHREAVLTADQGARTFAELAAAADRFAGYLAGLGVGRDDHVAVYAPNSLEWIVCALAAYRVGAAPVNVNYRYTQRELNTVLADSGSKVVVAARELAGRLAGVEAPSLLPGGLVLVEDGSGVAEPEDAVWFDRCLAGATFERSSPRTGGERYVMYTGGTTGAPKGVLWRHEDVLKAHAVHRDTVSEREAETPGAVLDLAAEREPITVMALGQLMHANGLWTTLKTLAWGDRLVIQRRFDPARVWKLVADHGVQILSFVGDAMARPLVEELEREPGRWDLSSLWVLTSAAAVFSAAVQDRFRELLPGVTLMEAIGTSETGMEGAAPITDRGLGGPVVAVGPDIGLVDEANRLLPLRPGARGRIARTGHIALGYHNDPEKTRSVFLEIDGRRWAVPGDYAEMVDADTMLLRGRGSASINTGGEKVFAEEVEATLKSHRAVLDAVVVGVPDDRWGQAVAAVVEFRDGASASLEQLREHCGSTLAGYKLPRVLAVTDQMRRSPSGKPDYRWARSQVRDLAGCEPIESGGTR
ncbi:MAG TPA: AMP-binding protein [Pseudonocardia sp.]|jgi:acyl-CoA synthetase (AMP-forming)/AMP-acid ligase II